jgi:hypothetical protein
MPSRERKAGVLETIEPPLNLPPIKQQALAESWQNPSPRQFAGDICKK